jgi:undecaprenyl-diphosphatase
MTLEQMIVLAIVQGVTEFLPISSSGHLILVPVLTGWRDQGLLVDVMAHIGSLLAIVVYFWRDVLRLLGGTIELLRGRLTPEGRLALYIIAATVPAVAFGLFVKMTGISDAVRGPHIVAWNAIIFALLMYAADRWGPHGKQMAEMSFWPALMVGIAQAIAIIPGTSRSGITITAGRALGFDRADAARFSFLLGIPAITGAGVLVLADAMESQEPISSDAVVTGAFTFLTSLAAIAFLMTILRRYSLLPFVLYRLALGALLLWLIHNGTIG